MASDSTANSSTHRPPFDVDAAYSDSLAPSTSDKKR